MSVTVETQALEVRGHDLTDQLAAIRIADVRAVGPDTLRNALERAVVIRNLADDYLREVGASFDPIVAKAHEAHKAAVKERDRLKGPAEDLKREAGRLGASYDTELRRRQAEADRLANLERERLQREADTAAERDRQAAQKAAEDTRLAEAATLETAGDAAGAMALIKAPVFVLPVVAAPVFVPPPAQIATKVEGASFGETWGAEVIDMLALVKAVAAGQQPLTYLKVDTVALNGVARALRGALAIPGVRAVPTPMARRTGRP